MANKRKTQIFSIFGQCEAAAAQTMIDKYGLHKIEQSEIPPTALFNDAGTKAVFAVVMPAKHLLEFSKLCADLRA